MSGEADQVKWRGVRPIDGIRGIWPEQNATRINKSEDQTGIGTTIIYTVPAGQKLYISTAGLCSTQTVNEMGCGILEVRNEADVLQYYLVGHYYDFAGQFTNFVNHFPACEAQAGWDVTVRSYNAAMRARGFIYGWLESA